MAWSLYKVSVGYTCEEHLTCLVIDIWGDYWIKRKYDILKSYLSWEGVLILFIGEVCSKILQVCNDKQMWAAMEKA